MGRPGSRLICLAIGILVLSLFSYSQATGIGAAINSTLDYVNMVNQSAYLVFYPNLSASYSYIGSAANVSHANPAYGQELLAMAMSSAKRQLDNVDAYRTESFLALGAVAVVLVVLLNRLMRPKKGRADGLHTSRTR